MSASICAEQYSRSTGHVLSYLHGLECTHLPTLPVDSRARRVCDEEKGQCLRLRCLQRAVHGVCAPAPLSKASETTVETGCVLTFPVSRWREIVYPPADDGATVEDLFLRALASV